MSLLNSIYNNSPVWAQNIGISAYGYKWKKRRFGGVFPAQLEAFKRREAYSQEQWELYQTKELRKLLIHAFETVPFYQEKYAALGFKAADFTHFELTDLKKLPILEKDDLRAFGKTTLISSKPERGGAFFSSSGSTGTPTSILYSIPFHQRWSAAFEARIRHWAGIDRRHSRGMIGGRRVIKEGAGKPPYYRYNFFEKQTYFSAYHISKTTAANYLKGIKKNKVSYMTGYAMSNFFLAEMFDQIGLEVPKMKAVITSSEKLTPNMRELFQKVYQCKTYDSYSGVEACGLISENQFGELVVSPDVGVLEIVDQDGQNVNPGESGIVLSTGLLNFDQPLIRYNIGDSITLASNQQSKAGVQMPLIESIQGRVEDKVVGKDGREIVRFHGLYINVPFLVAAQIIQLDYEDFLFKVVVEEGFSEKEEVLITKRLESQLGPVRATFERLDQIPKNKNGKFQAVISHLNKKLDP